ncbi:unnamed protein product [Lampetra planeri]
MEKYTQIGEEFYELERRKKTYDDRWPYKENCACTPEQMAIAGFLHQPSDGEVDAVICFFCFKELDGWEQDDVPLMEHKKHSSDCGFLTRKKEFEDLTVQEFIILETERQKNLLKKVISTKKTEFLYQADAVRRQLEQLHDL